MSARKISLRVSEADFEFAERMAERDGYFGPEDCLNGILNIAILNHRSPPTRDGRDHVLARLLAEKRVLQETLVLLTRHAAECNLPHCDGECFQHIPDDDGAGYEDDIPF